MKKNDNIKVLLVTQYMPHYRIPIYNMINDRVDLTVLHSQPNIKECNFKQVFTHTGSIGPFLYFKINLNKFCKNYSAVIIESNIRFIDRNALLLNPFKKYKTLSWGIGLAASYTKRLGDRDFFHFFRLYLQKKSDASILYSSFPVDIYTNSGIERESIFIANNTIFFDAFKKPDLDKNILLFIGTLYKQKKLERLIYAYKESYKKCKIQYPLIIIGDGEEGESLKRLVNKIDMSDKIIFVGNIVDQEVLSTYFSKSLACISPGQAGLGVLTSMANSVPFVTQRGAITGGEIFNINDSNGVIYNSDNDLEDLICDIANNRDKYIKMGENARNYYLNSRSPELMIEAMFDAIGYVLKI